MDEQFCCICLEEKHKFAYICFQEQHKICQQCYQQWTLTEQNNVVKQFLNDDIFCEHTMQCPMKCENKLNNIWLWCHKKDRCNINAKTIIEVLVSIDVKKEMEMNKIFDWKWIDFEFSQKKNGDLNCLISTDRWRRWKSEDRIVIFDFKCKGCEYK